MGAATLSVVASKTDAGVRSVDLTAALREELRRWWRETKYDRPDDYVLPTPTGRQSNPSNLRRDVLRPTIKRANEELNKDGIAPIDAITFHSLRTTYASLRCACRDDVAYTSSQLGHEDARFTLKVYTQATKRRERLSGAHRRAYDVAIPSWSVCWLLQRQQKTPPERGFVEADEGTRTLDLLQGEASVYSSRLLSTRLAPLSRFGGWRVDPSRPQGRRKPLRKPIWPIRLVEYALSL
jgi:Phage integrase family